MKNDDKNELHVNVHIDDLALPEVEVDEENEAAINAYPIEAADEKTTKADSVRIDYSGAFPEIHIGKN